MGLLSSIKGLAKEFYQGDIQNAVDFVKQNPFGAAAGVLAPVAATIPIVQSAAIATLSKAKSAFSSLTLKQQVLGTPIAIVSAGALVNSAKTREAVIKAPTSLYNVGANVGKFVENPSLASATNVFKENPVATTLLGVGSAALIGYGTSGLIASALSTSATRANTKAMINNTASSKVSETKDKVMEVVKDVTPPKAAIPQTIEKAKDTVLPSTVPVPVEPQVAPITSKVSPVKSSSKRRRRSSKAKSINRTTFNMHLDVKSNKRCEGIC